jgi:release factor glutamine methyltransferase
MPTLDVVATDTSADALAVAQANAVHLHLSVTFHHGDWFAALPDPTRRFDLLVSNPPYIALQDAHLAALRHEPTVALSSGTDGLNAIRHLTSHAPAHLRAGGWLLLEHGYDQAPRVQDLLLQAGFTRIQSRRDLSGIERCTGGCWAGADEK